MGKPATIVGVLLMGCIFAFAQDGTNPQQGPPGAANGQAQPLSSTPS